MRAEIVTRVEDALCSPYPQPWLPGLARELEDVGWGGLRDEFGIHLASYGTGRVTLRSATAPREVEAHLRIAGNQDPFRFPPQVEILSGEASRGYVESGVRFYTAAEIRELELCVRLEEAFNLMELEPTLRESMFIMIRSIHLVDAGHDDYDVSFSEPNLPFSVFVSVPRSRDGNTTLRVAEGLIHEAMHLQLSLVERVVTLVRSEMTSFFSPWRNELRTSGGLLHAIYVFRVLDSFFSQLLLIKLLSSAQEVYVKDRRRQIREQIGEVRAFKNSPDLTQTGKLFVSRLIEPTGWPTA